MKVVTLPAGGQIHPQDLTSVAAMPSLDMLAADHSRAAELSPEQAAIVVTQAAALLNAVAPVLATSARRPPPVVPAAPPAGELTVAEVAQRLRKSERWVRDHRREIPGSFKRGRTVLFSAEKLEKWRSKSS